MELAEDLVVSVVARVLEKRRRELTIIGRDISKLEAVRSRSRASRTTMRSSGCRPGTADPVGRRLRRARRDHAVGGCDRPVLVHRYPPRSGVLHEARSRSRRPRARRRHARARGLRRIIGGGERLADLDLLLQRIKEHKPAAGGVQWYLDLRRYGAVPHGGFGMGIERVCRGSASSITSAKRSVSQDVMRYAP
jgi:asparaginyl-tRNA synthetase